MFRPAALADRSWASPSVIRWGIRRPGLSPRPRLCRLRLRPPLPCPSRSLRQAPRPPPPPPPSPPGAVPAAGAAPEEGAESPGEGPEDEGGETTGIPVCEGEEHVVAAFLDDEAGEDEEAKVEIM